MHGAQTHPSQNTIFSERKLRLHIVPPHLTHFFRSYFRPAISKCPVSMHPLNQTTHSAITTAFPATALLYPYASQPFPCGSYAHPCQSQLFPCISHVHPVRSKVFPRGSETFPCRSQSFPRTAFTHLYAPHTSIRLLCASVRTGCIPRCLPTISGWRAAAKIKRRLSYVRGKCIPIAPLQPSASSVMSFHYKYVKSSKYPLHPNQNSMPPSPC